MQRDVPLRSDELTGTAEAVFQALGEASMCWHPRPTGEFDSSHALEIGNRLLEQIDGREPLDLPFREIRRRFCIEMRSDDGLNIAYHANIAMAIHDNSGLPVEQCSHLATAVMDRIFGA
jgi:hypothetical protein